MLSLHVVTLLWLISALGVSQFGLKGGGYRDANPPVVNSSWYKDVTVPASPSSPFMSLRTIPSSLVILLGFNKEKLTHELQKYKEFMKGPTRDEVILGHSYTTVNNAFQAISHAALVHLDHVMIPSYRQELKLDEPERKSRKTRPSESIGDLPACLEWFQDWRCGWVHRGCDVIRQLLQRLIVCHRTLGWVFSNPGTVLNSETPLTTHPNSSSLPQPLPMSLHSKSSQLWWRVHGWHHPHWTHRWWGGVCLQMGDGPSGDLVQGEEPGVHLG